MFYPRVLAPRHWSPDLEWREPSGTGTLRTFTVARRLVGPHFADAVPQQLVIVEWGEGPREIVPPSMTKQCCDTRPPDHQFHRKLVLAHKNYLAAG